METREGTLLSSVSNGQRALVPHLSERGGVGVGNGRVRVRLVVQAARVVIVGPLGIRVLARGVRVPASQSARHERIRRPAMPPAANLYAMGRAGVPAVAALPHKVGRVRVRERGGVGVGNGRVRVRLVVQAARVVVVAPLGIRVLARGVRVPASHQASHDHHAPTHAQPAGRLPPLQREDARTSGRRYQL